MPTKLKAKPRSRGLKVLNFVEWSERLTAQPLPIKALVSEVTDRFGRVVATGLTRIWSPGDTLKCRLCTKCMADHEHNVCLVMIDRQISHDIDDIAQLKATVRGK